MTCARVGADTFPAQVRCLPFECVCVRERDSMCVRERNRERVCVCERERACVCVRESVCVCDRERSLRVGADTFLAQVRCLMLTLHYGQS